MTFSAYLAKTGKSLGVGVLDTKNYRIVTRLVTKSERKNLSSGKFGHLLTGHPKV